MSTEQPRSSSTRSESGFALILALLALLLLTFLGLTLAVTTSTELQIATNYRWSEQARYAAEAGLEIAKVELRSNTAWGDGLLPVRRDGAGTTLTWDGVAPSWTAPAARVVGGVTLRDFENAGCDLQGNGMGYGMVLLGDTGPQQYVSTFNTLQLSGAFTAWVRRPTWIQANGQFADWGAQVPGPPLFDPVAETLILTVEGVAPFTSAGAYTDTGAGSAMVARSKAVYTIQLPFSQSGTGTPDTCQPKRGGQTGGGALNDGYGGCLGPDPLRSAFGGSTASGTGNSLQAGQ